MMCLNRLRPWFCTAVVIIGLLEFLFEKSFALVFTGGAIVLFAFVFLFPLISFYSKAIAFALCGSSLLAFFLFQTPVPPAELIGGFTEMAPLVAVMAAVNILGIPLELGRYAELFQRFYARAKGPSQPYVISLLISYVLTLLSLAGAVAPSYYLVKENLRKLGLEKNSRLETTSVARGYAMALIVSPVAATVGIAVKYSGLSWPQLVGPVFLLSLAGLAAAFFMEASRLAGKNGQIQNQVGEGLDLPQISSRRLASFLVLFIGVVGSTLLLGNVWRFPSLNSIALGCLFATFIWGVVSNQLSPLMTRSFSFFSQGIIKMADQTTLFIAAGFFTYAMEASGALKLVGNLMELVAGRVDIVFILAAVPLIIMLLAFIGLHPFASGIIIAKTLLASPLEFNALGLALALMGGMSMSFILSPFSILVLILSSITGKSPYKLGVRWNSAFAVVFWGLTAVFILFVTRLP
ncbi:MAG: hypothetical protein ACOX1X_02970 [Dethiobacteria bacterium]